VLSPGAGDEIVGYISLGRGITIHREDCANARALSRDPDRFTPVAWEGGQTTGFKVELQIDGWDRHGCSRISHGRSPRRA